MDRTGRKKLLGVGYIIAGVFCILMTISLNLQDVVPGMSYLSIVCVVGFIIGFAIGPGIWIFKFFFTTQKIFFSDIVIYYARKILFQIFY